MKARDFCYWLQGYLELSPPGGMLNDKQVEVVRAHLNMVFVHEIDPSFPAAQQLPLDIAHAGHNHGPHGPAMRC